MTIKVTLDDMFSTTEVLRRLNGVQFQSEKVAYFISRLSRTVENEIKQSQPSTQSLWDKYAVKDENGKVSFDKNTNQVNFTPENRELFEVEWSEFKQAEVELPLIPIKIELFKDINGKNVLLPRDISVLYKFIDVSSMEEQNEVAK